MRFTLLRAFVVAAVLANVFYAAWSRGALGFIGLAPATIFAVLAAAATQGDAIASGVTRGISDAARRFGRLARTQRPRRQRCRLC